MNSFRLIYALILGAVALLFSLSCRHENPVKPDPCKGLKPVSADFEVFETSGGGGTRWEYVACDTIIVSDIILKAIEEGADEYLWKVGFSEYKGRSINLSISSEDMRNLSYFPVQLIVKKKPNLACFPKDDGIDTFAKKVYINHQLTPDSSTSLIPGRYRGVRTDLPNDTFVLSIHRGVNPLVPRVKGYIVKNFHNGCNIYATTSGVGSYRVLSMDSGAGIPRVEPKECDSEYSLWVLRGNRLSVKYGIAEKDKNGKYYDPTNTYEFIGTKIR